MWSVLMKSVFPKRRRRPSLEEETRARVLESSDILKQCLKFLNGHSLNHVSCVNRSCRCAARSVWPELVRQLYDDKRRDDEFGAKRYYFMQRRRRLLADRLGENPPRPAWRNAVRSLADLVFFVRITDGDRFVWEGDAHGAFEVDHICLDLSHAWRDAKEKWPHLARLFQLRQEHGRRVPPYASQPPDFFVDKDLEDAAFKNIAISLVAVRQPDEKMCLLAKMTTVERVDYEDLDYGLSTQPIETPTFMTFREPTQQPGIQGFLQFWTDDAAQKDDDIDCLNLFMTAGKLNSSNNVFAEDYDLNEQEVICLFDSFQWT